MTEINNKEDSNKSKSSYWTTLEILSSFTKKVLIEDEFIIITIPGEKMINRFFTAGILQIINNQFNNHCLIYYVYQRVK